VERYVNLYNSESSVIHSNYYIDGTASYTPLVFLQADVPFLCKSDDNVQSRRTDTPRLENPVVLVIVLTVRYTHMYYGVPDNTPHRNT